MIKQPSRRNIELVLLILGWGIGLLGAIQIDASADQQAPASFWVIVGVIGALGLAMNITLRFTAKYADPLLLPVAMLLTILGLLMIFRLDVAAAQRATRNETQPPTQDVYAQLTWLAIASILFVAVLIVIRDHRLMQR